MANDPLRPPRAPIKPFWRDPLGWAVTAAALMLAIGMALERQYPLASSLLQWVGLPLMIASLAARIVRRRSGRPY